MASSGRVDPRVAEAGFRALVRGNERALVTGINSHGFFAPMPLALQDHGRSVLQARSALDLVLPAEREQVIDTWHRAIAAGAAHTCVRLSCGADANLDFFDVRPLHDVLVGVLIPSGDVELAALAQAPDVTPRVCYQEKNETATFVDVDEATTKMLGWRRDDIVGHGSLEFVHPDDHERAIESWMDMLASTGMQLRTRLRYRHANGSWLWVELVNHNHFDDPQRACVVTEMLDVSDEMAAHEEVRTQERLLRRVAETVPLGLLHLDRGGDVVYANERFHTILGVPKGTAEPFRTLTPEHAAAARAALDSVFADGIDRDIEVTAETRRHDEERRCLLRLRSLTGPDGAVDGAIVCVEDITERARTHAELQRRATFDPLTSCLNRASVLQTITAQLERGFRVGVIYIDLDDFKSVNDTYGHHAGDMLLVEVAQRVQQNLRATDTVGRLGGDEFLVVCHDQQHDALDVLAQRITSTLGAPIHLEPATVHVAASMGIALAHGGATTCDDLVAEADAAMYAAKRHARQRAAS